MVNPEDMMPKDKNPEDKHKSFFGGDKKQPFDASILSTEVANLSRTVRTLEERTANIVKKSQIAEQNMLTNNKKVNSEVETMNDDLNDIKKVISDIKDHLRHLVDELKRGAKKEEIKVLQRYIDMWEPVNFVTRNEVEKIIKDILGK